MCFKYDYNKDSTSDKDLSLESWLKFIASLRQPGLLVNIEEKTR